MTSTQKAKIQAIVASNAGSVIAVFIVALGVYFWDTYKAGVTTNELKLLDEEFVSTSEGQSLESKIEDVAKLVTETNKSVAANAVNHQSYVKKTNAEIAGLSLDLRNHDSYEKHFPKPSVVSVESHEAQTAIFQNQFTALNTVLTDLKRDINRLEEKIDEL